MLFTDPFTEMFLYCLIIFSCLDFSSMFPTKGCRREFKNLLAVWDCRGQSEEQRNFFDSFSNYMNSNKKLGQIKKFYGVLLGNKCSQNVNVDDLYYKFEYNETLPIPLVLEYTKLWGDQKDVRCGGFMLSFIFLFNMKNINNNNNPIMKEIMSNNNVNISRASNRFFIIQTSEKPSLKYLSMDFIHFTSSFKKLNVNYIFNKICDLSTDNNTIIYQRKGYIKSEYRIVNQLSDIHTGWYLFECFCQRNFGMKIISLESYDEFVEIIQYLNNMSIANSTEELNLFLALADNYHLMWYGNSNPFLFLKPTMIYHDRLGGPYFCYYLNLSNKTSTILYQDKSLYNLGKYMKQIPCRVPLYNPLIICESEDVILDELSKQYDKIKDIAALTKEYIDNTLNSMLFLSNQNCFSDTPIIYSKINASGSVYRTCINNLITENNIKTKNTRKKIITLLFKGTNSFYTLLKVDISKCKLYNECQTMSYNETYYKLSNPNVDIFCVDDRNNQTFNDTCSIISVNLSLNLEYVQCKSNKSQYSLKCIKEHHDQDQCEDFPHLQNCENYICPEPFIKCVNSYCIYPEMIKNQFRDCPNGEDEEYSFYKEGVAELVCNASLILYHREICVDSITFKTLNIQIENDAKFVCDNNCPNNFKCVSSKFEHHGNLHQEEIHFIEPLGKNNNILHILGILSRFLFKSNLYSVISFKGSNCTLSNFDYELQYFKFQDLVELDASYNQITHSNYFKSVEQYWQLKRFNLSHNENLILDHFFNFPRTLEIIDLSYTQIKTLRNQVFANLKDLKHLNLSHTLITKFKDMGLPEYFALDTFDIQSLKIRDVNKNIFKGLTINTELKASDYVICCPQILNTNISVDKCHAPVDLISSCKHLVGDTFKRIVIWIVGLLTLVGNSIVLLYRIGWDREIFKKAYGHFITGLAISDLIMGIYLVSIAIVDVYYKDVYVTEDFQWRHGFACNFCGFLSTLSSEASTFFICLITVDRYLCITYPFGEHRFSKTGKQISLTLVWLTSFVLALIPVILSDWEIYSSNGLCLALPLSPTQNKGWIFSFVVFVVINFLLFLFIAVGQLTIFMNLMKVKKSISSVTQNQDRKSEELSIAIKLAFVAFTDFCCWFPIGILGFLSFNGYIFNREVYAWIAVFVLPINSALNPIMYTIPAVYTKCKTMNNQIRQDRDCK